MSDVEVVEGEDETGRHEHDPRGTVALMVIFVLVIIAMWVWAYYTLLDQS